MSKLFVQKIETHIQGSIKDHDYGIGDIGLVLEILRNKLYKDPILAVVREYITNARDAHVEAGKSELPINVTLPDSENLYFKVQDFGPGLSPERIEKIFCNYASSTKRGSEDQVGYFGIGSKSAFAYSDSFTIISVHNGITRTYSSYIDESRKGKISCLYEAYSDQPNGTTIIIPVKRSDCYYFEEKLIEITQFWDIRPNVIKNNNNHNLHYKNEQILFSGEDWSLNRTDDWKARSAHAIMGGISYPIDVSSHFNNYRLKSFFMNCPIRIKFNNSDLSLAASRDSLHYDSRTIRTIKDRFDKIINEINSKIIDQINEEPDYCSALVRFNLTISHNQELTKVIDTIYYKDKPLIKNPRINIFGKTAKLTWYNKTILSSGFENIQSKSVNSRSSNSDIDFYHILNSIETVLIFNDNISSNMKKYAVKIFKDDPSVKSVVFLTISDDKEISDKHPYLWFANEICSHKISEIVPDKLVRVNSKNKLSNKDNIFVYKFDYKSSRSDLAKKVIEVSKNEEIVYFTYDSKVNKPTDINHISVHYLSNVEYLLNKKIYGISESKKNLVPNNWIHLNDIMDLKMKEALDKMKCKDVHELMDWMNSKNSTIDNMNNTSYSIFDLLKDQEGKGNIIDKYVKESKRIKNINDISYEIQGLNYIIEFYIQKESLVYSDLSPLSKVLGDMNKEMHKTYPLLKYIFKSYEVSDVEKNHMNFYIESVDSK